MVSSQTASLHIRALSKKYGSNLALSELNLSIYPQQICGLLGENGAGKTTTLKIISGIIEKTSGSVEVGGISLEQHPIEAKKICFLFRTMPSCLKKCVGTDT